jgi:hypothetical protein
MNKQMLRMMMMMMMVMMMMVMMMMMQNRGLLTAKISAKHDGLISIQVSNSVRLCEMHGGGVRSCVTSSYWPMGGAVVLIHE